MDHFTDEKIDDITSGRAPLTDEEREFLLSDTPRYEECTRSREELAAMSDQNLMSAAYSVWADYAKSMY